MTSTARPEPRRRLYSSANRPEEVVSPMCGKVPRTPLATFRDVLTKFLLTNNEVPPRITLMGSGIGLRHQVGRGLFL